jgi:thiol:disulfide interchange protein
MALPMGLTALALAWLCWRVGGDRFAIAASITAIALVTILSITGKKQHRGERSLPQLTVALLILAIGASYGLSQLAAPGKATQAASLLASKPFSETALAKARASGRPVFVYFTADWCLTCKVNEKIAIEREVTRAAFERAGVVVLKGDWTRRDPEITRYLTAQGAAGVPLYVWYPKGNAVPQQLPQVLGPDSLPALVR